MRPSSDSTSTINVWRSPTPYLFGSLGLLLAIIAVALTSLACSYYRNSSGDQEEKPAAMLTSMPVLHAELARDCCRHGRRGQANVSSSTIVTS